MCGLAGYMGSRHPDPMKLRLLLLDNEERGRHSTGLYGSRLMRKVGTANSFVQDPNFDTITKAKVVLGHTRHATGGAHTKENAHPFLISKDLVGTHNGWLVNTYEMEQKYGEEIKDDVDSHSLYKMIGKADDPKAFAMAEGAMALAFKYKGDGYLYRRESRPLFIAKGDGGLYYSSKQEGLRLCGFRKIFIVTPHILYQIRDGVIIEKTDIDPPRVKISEGSYMHSWDSGISDELKETLTGKKPIAPVWSSTGAAERDKRNAVLVGKSSEEVSKLVTERLSKYGSELSGSVKREIYNFLEFYDKGTAISKVYNYDSDYDNLDANSIDGDNVKGFLDKEVISNSFMSRKMINDVSYVINEHIPQSKAGFVINLYGFDDIFGIRALDASKFIAIVSGNVAVMKGQGKVGFYNAKAKDNRILGSVDLMSYERAWITLTLADAEVKGLLLSTTLSVVSGGKNTIDLYIPMGVYDDLRTLCIKGDATTRYASAAYASKDITRIAEVMTYNNHLYKDYEPWKGLPFLKTSDGYFIKHINFQKDNEGEIQSMMHLEEADEKDKAQVDTCCISEDPFVGVNDNWDDVTDLRTSKKKKRCSHGLEMKSFYENTMTDINVISENLEILKAVVEKKNSEVDKLDPLSPDHFALLEMLRKLKDVTTSLFYIKVDMRKSFEEVTTV